MVETYAYLAKVYKRLDQPLSAVDHLQQGLSWFTNDTTLLTWLARIFEEIGDSSKSVEFYKLLLKQDSSSVEAIACMGTNYFYNSLPEIALKFYR